MNVHRWRILESSDPKRFETITMIQSLQKQLVSKTDRITELDLLIQEKEKLYVELKNIISRQPDGNEIAEQLLVYQQTYKEKNKQLKSMEDELYMYRQQIASFKQDISNMENQMSKLNKKWVKTKAQQSHMHSSIGNFDQTQSNNLKNTNDYPYGSLVDKSAAPGSAVYQSQSQLYPSMNQDMPGINTTNSHLGLGSEQSNSHLEGQNKFISSEEEKNAAVGVF